MIEITLLPGKGRGYKATEDIPAGTKIHVSEPLATTVSQDWTPETCFWCFHFNYPKKLKIKTLNEQEQEQLAKQWNVSKKTLLFKDILFCSEQCKFNCQKSLGSEWVPMLGVLYRLDLEFKQIHSQTSIPHHSTQMKLIDIKNDQDLSSWLDNAWTCVTEDLTLLREIDDTDKSMCRLIAACILRKHHSQFQDLLVIQNNELSHFKTHASYHQLPSNCTKEEYLSILPSEVIDVMALYCFFARAVTKDLNNVPTLEVNHELFRSIYFRERANSFGLWEMGDDEVANACGGVSDDLELLGFGIYPSAVYFNHSCDANVIKIREGRNMTFITRRMIHEGEEACISYGSVDEDVQSRRSRLLEHYHFVCQCTRCLEESTITR